MSDIVGLEAFNDVKRLIVVGAHPDDLECACGGTILLLIERGVEVHSVSCTLGDIGTQDGSIVRSELAVTRLGETKAAARQLGLASTHNLGYPDGELTPSLELRSQLVRLYRITQADTLFTFDPHWNGQVHPDHRAAGRAAIDAYMPAKMPLYHPEQLADPAADLGVIERVFAFAVGEGADTIVDTSSVLDRKVANCAAHCSQFPDGEESLGWMKEMAAHAGQRIGLPAAEAFRSIGVW